MRKIGLLTITAWVILSEPAAASDDAILRRLDALEKQNAALRDRVRQLETGSNAKRSSHAHAIAAAPAAPEPLRASSFNADYESFSWAGFHVGGFAGADLFSPISELGGDQTPTTSAVIGGSTGYDWQRASFVYGVEGDIASAVGGEYTQFGNLPGGKVDGAYSKTQAVATLRARAGVAVDRALIYGTIGVGGILNKQMISIGDLNLYVTRTQVVSALVIGGGIQYALTDHWIVAGEGLYLAADRETFAPSGGFAQVSPSQEILKAGVQYKF